MSYSFLMIYYNDLYNNMINSNGSCIRKNNTIKQIKQINKNKEGCIKSKFVLKSVLMNYLNK